MNLLGFLRKAWPASRQASSTPGSGGWINVIREPFTGAWQRNIEWRLDSVLTYSAVFRSISLISSDIAKMRVRLVKFNENGIWTETYNTAHSPVLYRPNRYQNRIQFFSNWMESKLTYGNTYVLKERDQRNVVSAMYVLDPALVNVLVAPDGAVFYELKSDRLVGVPDQSLVVPASEMIHDRWNTINHPLVGTSPIHACGLAATQGLRIQAGSTAFFANGSTPGGLISAPGSIKPEAAARVKEFWETNYTGNNVGKVAVLGDGMKYESVTIPAAESQLIEQLQWTAETVASVFGVPAYKIGVGPAPTYNNIEALDSQYYSQCLQIHIESIELCLDDGLELKGDLGTEFDLDGLLRMDTATKVKAAAEGVKAGFMAPNEARAKFDLPPVQGGDSPYLQIQNYSLRALDKRDQTAVPVTPGLDAQQAPPEENDDNGNGGDDDDTERERERRVIHLERWRNAITRSAREHGRRRSA